ncbi:uncharacterized protein LOC120253803 [Dioscorea cayenensis subsp. rotundata]|uniref:Uncharacterized protein LOC120253803 n=1 Tax=Dioscorea cayennensis subsp. rotundata TaxID=55577 RepID=A0AB40ASA9_DIOCR|nr:uncharacterized protein LOC120253803 [Dioscorea cayenensis subsp. rotundata]
MERNRESMEVFLKSAMENLGREKIDGKEMDMMDKRTHHHHHHHHHHHQHVEMLRRRMEVVEEYSQMLLEGDWNSKVKGGCSYCKEVMRRVLEQVRAETDHWNEMQVMVEKVRVEMEELQVSRDLWRRRASSAELNLRLVHAKMLEWQWRARASESKLIELKKEREETNKSSRNSERIRSRVRLIVLRT